MNALEYIKEINPEAVVLTGLDDAIIGCTYFRGLHLLVYSRAKIIKILLDRDGMTFDEAEEFFGFNIECLHAGDHTPVIVDEDVADEDE